MCRGCLAAALFIYLPLQSELTDMTGFGFSEGKLARSGTTFSERSDSFGLFVPRPPEMNAFLFLVFIDLTVSGFGDKLTCSKLLGDGIIAHRHFTGILKVLSGMADR